MWVWVWREGPAPPHTSAPQREWLQRAAPPLPPPLSLAAPFNPPFVSPDLPSPLLPSLCCSRRAVERRKRRFYEEQEDALDRQREAQEGPMAKRQGAYHDTDNHERNGGSDDNEIRRVGVASGSGSLSAFRSILFSNSRRAPSCDIRGKMADLRLPRSTLPTPHLCAHDTILCMSSSPLQGSAVLSPCLVPHFPVHTWA